MTIDVLGDDEIRFEGRYIGRINFTCGQVLRDEFVAVLEEPDYEAELNAVEAAHADEIQKLNEAHEVKVELLEAELNAVEAAHADEIQKLNEAHEVKVELLEAELRAADDEALDLRNELFSLRAALEAHILAD